jgi:nucleoside-diphosphate-sugar epimerase
MGDLIENERELEEELSRPGAALREFARGLKGPLIILGAGGKMGPTLAAMAMRAAEGLEVVAVSRFNDARAEGWLKERGVRTIGCDLLNDDLRALPDASNVIYLVGLKFGTSSDPSTTWVMNTVVPARVMERYRGARIVALSTGNVYGNCEVARGGSMETDALTPIGEYPNSAVGRERVFEFYARRNGTAVALMRLFYAVELRYGVLVDIAQKVWRGEEIHLENGSFNCIWQRDANERILRALELAASPASVFNLCQPQIFSVREIAQRLGELFGREAKFAGAESGTALIANAEKLVGRLGAPETSMETMLKWIAHWVKCGGRNLEKPTHFEERGGSY